MSIKTQKSQRIAKRRQQKQITTLGLIGLAGLLLLAAAAFLIKNNQPAPPVPVEVNGTARLKVDKEQVDLGDIKLGTPVKVDFTVSNVGDQQLKLSEQPYVEVIEGC